MTHILSFLLGSIFGREWLRQIKFNWTDTKLVEVGMTENLEELFRRFADVFF